MDDVGFSLWRHRFHAPHFLETQIVPDKSGLPELLHCSRSLLHLRHRLILRHKSRASGSGAHSWDLRRAYFVCVSKQI